MSLQKEIYVYAHWKELHAPTLMGVLHVTPARGKEIFSFEYDRAWIDAGHKHTIDPDLQFYTGQQYLKEEKNNFGIFLDSSPDRWGRVLMRRREAAEAKLESRKPKTLLESDYLLGVFDGHRMGAIRFKESMDGAFQHDHKEQAAPPWANLRELEHASLELEKENSADDPEYMKWLNMLIAPGASLGGARPKASILDLENNLWFAKFPSATDDKDVGAWEMVVHDLAIQCKINMSTARIQKFSSNHHTYLTKRFDRTAGNQRIHFASAMTLLGYTDGTDYNDGVSYLELAEFIMKQGAKPDQDLEELWRRIVFSICVKNTDDHLRNHGFLLTDMGWLLSPAYDINPVETGTGLTLNISEVDNALDLNLAREVAVYFRLNNNMANKIIDEVKSAVKNWPLLATKYGISREEQSMMSPAFENSI